MSESKSFLERWSRRKREAADAGAREAAVEKPHADQVNEGRPTTPAPRNADAKQEKPVFEPASLPPIDSIGADTDIRDFLRPDVPPDLARAALRRAWSSDPAIRDYVGPVENGWDFTNPDAVPGFGTIEPREIPRLLGRVIGALASEEPKPSAQDEPVTHQDSAATRVPLSAAPAANAPQCDAAADANPSRCERDAAPQNGSDGSISPSRGRTSPSRNI
jgi:hypothetical protein